MEQYVEAFKPEGWYDGLVSMSGKWKNLRIITHAETATIIEFLKSGKFGTSSRPLSPYNRI